MNKRQRKKIKTTQRYLGELNGTLGIYCIKCNTALDSKMFICPGCKRSIKGI